MSEMLELAKRIAERAGKNAKVAPELLYAPILWELQDDARCSAASEELEARLALADELMLPGGTHPYLGARKRAMIVAALRARVEPQASAVSAEPVAYAIYGIGGGKTHLHGDKAIKDEWEMDDDCLGDYWSGNVALYAAPSPARTEPQAARPVDLEAIAEIVQSERAAGSGHYDTAQKLLEYFVRCQADSSPQTAPELTATCQKLLPGGIIDDATYAEIEDALDRADAPATVGGRWLKLHERIAALTAERPAASAEPQSQAVSAPTRTREDRLWDWRNELQNSYGNGPYGDGLITQKIAEIDKELAALTRPVCEGK